MKVHLFSLCGRAPVKQEFQWEKLIAEKFVNLELLGHMICCDLRSVKISTKIKSKHNMIS